MTSTGRDERGAIAVLAAGFVALAVALALALGQLGAAAVAQAKAQSAADAAALAAADQLALGRGNGAARRAAVGTAADNGARLVHCWCESTFAEVHVELVSDPVAGAGRRASAKSRAEIDFTRARARGS